MSAETQAANSAANPPVPSRWRRAKRFAIILVAGAACLFAAIYLLRGVPKHAADALRLADRYELLSLNPMRSEGGFHDYQVLGQVVIDDPAVRSRLNRALQSGARWPLAWPSLCFTPRHGIRVTRNGEVTDLVICFECEQVQVWQGERQLSNFVTAQFPQSTFDAVLKEAGVPLAAKGH